MSEELKLIDITPRDNEMSKEDAEKFRAENQPRGHEALEDEKRMKELEARRAELLERLHELGEDVEPVAEDKVEKKSGPAALVEKLKENKSFRAKVTGITAAALISAGIIISSIAIAGGNTATEVPIQPTTPSITFEVETPTPAPEDDTVDIEEREASGIIDGYGEEGMWESDGKTGPYAFADFEKVVEMHDGDVKEAVKDVASKQVESMADCISGMSDQVRPDGYQGLSMAEIDEKIENLSDVEYDLLREEFNKIIDKADIKEVTLEGKYDNAYMGVKVDDQIMGSKEAVEKDVEINHETMQLIKCTTNEKGSKAYELTWTDENGKTIDSEMIKEACTQVVEKEGKNPGRFKGLPEATEKAIAGGGAMTVTITGGGPVITPTPTPPKPKPTPTPKPWGKSGDPHTGTDYKQTIVTNPAVPDISHINDGNQGYVDDNQAAPGAPSEFNGVSDSGFADSGIVAPGASTEGERLSGGENQGTQEMAGENAYHSEASIEQGQKQDDAGNQAQESAQESNDVGGDNNSDSQEESRVAEGNF